MIIIKGYKTELDPNNKQRTLLLKNAGTARFVYNWGLNIKKQAMEKKTRIPSAIDLHRELVKLKQTEHPWLYETSKCSPQEALRNLDNAFKNFFRKCKLKKQGKFKGKVGFPKFKNKKKGIGSFRLYGSINIMNNHIQLPRLGKIKLKEKSYLPINAKTLNVTISERAGRWFASIQAEQEIELPKEKKHDVIGVDLGIKTLAVCSNGEIFENPKALRSRLKKLCKLQRWTSRKKLGSKNKKNQIIN